MSAPKKRSYHHGNLRQALIDMAVRLAEERGHEELSLREVATLRLRLLVERDQRAAPADPLARIHALGHSFIDWALDQPAQFRIVSARRLFDFEGSARLAVHFAAVRDLTVTLVAQAQQAGALPAGVPPQDLALSLRATAYGLARMAVDGQLPQWQVDPSAARRHLKALLALGVAALAVQESA